MCVWEGEAKNYRGIAIIKLIKRKAHVLSRSNVLNVFSCVYPLMKYTH